jgi:2-methylcitrate dehydratase PrpD
MKFADGTGPNWLSGGKSLSRRDLLSKAGQMTAAGLLSPLAGIAGQSSTGGAPATGLPGSTKEPAISPMMSRLSTYMSEARSRALPAEVIEKAKHHILDTIGAMISGADLPPGRAALRFAGAYGSDKGSTVVASRLVCGPIEAALTNGVLAHSDETDDSHGPSRAHPGAAVIPAALAAGEEFNVDGAHFLRAVALGYDVGTRILMAMGGPGYQSDTHRSTHATAGTFCAAAAAGCAAGLDAHQMRLLLDYTSQQASGFGVWQRDTYHIEKAFVFGGMTARSGVTAALLVRSGWTGVEDVFSGDDNFFEAYRPGAKPASVVELLGERYEVMRTNIKKWTVGSPIQAPLDGLEIMFKKRNFGADDVKKVVVRLSTDEAMTVNNREMPDICLQHMVAVMLLDKTVTFAATHDKERMKDPAVLRQRAKVELLSDPAIDARRPLRECILDVTLNDGTQLHEYVKDVRGTTENPMPRAEVAGKCRDLIMPVLGAAQSDRLIAAVLDIESVKNVRELRPLLQRG